MIAYLDLSFIAGIVLFDPKENILSAQSIVALIVLSFTVFLPWLVLFYLFAKFGGLNPRINKIMQGDFKSWSYIKLRLKMENLIKEYVSLYHASIFAYISPFDLNVTMRLVI